uniref:Molybdopterin molybdenumtransferase MoeA n=1 Tax=Thermosphaera aggregans TaxID=54254 RepID=A0A7C2FQA8_9CREN
MKILKGLIEVDEAVAAFAKVLSKISLQKESVRIEEALGRIVASDVKAEFDFPDQDRSAVDGYAVLAEDTYYASQYNPVELKIVNNREGDLCVERGVAFEVFTGNPIPCGANSVVMKEDTVRDNDKILVLKPVPVGGNISRKGEDYAKGSVLVGKGTVVNPFHIAIMASNGLKMVEVFEKLKIGIISTGNEIVSPGLAREHGEYYDSTGTLIHQLLIQDGFYRVTYYGIFPDDVKALTEALEEATLENDIVITLGGTGVSESDVVIDAAEKIGEQVFRGVKMRPGRPTSSSLVNGKPVLHLSGYPVAAWTGYEVILRRAVAKAFNLVNYKRHVAFARLSRRLPNQAGYQTYIRVQLKTGEGELTAEPYMLRGSGVLSSLVFSHGYVEIPSNIEGFEKGDIVKVFLF